MTETFLSEVGVLLLVFPMLEKFITTGPSGLTPRFVMYSFGGAITFYFMASVLAIYTGDQEA